MTAHELMIKTNHYLIKGGQLTVPQKTNIVRQFLAVRSNEGVKQNFYRGVNSQEYLLEQSTDDRIMYPLFFIPPYKDGKKMQTVLPMFPKTHILSANSYELEIIRLLYLFTRDDSVIQDMVHRTIKRLKTTCFADRGCHQGECFHSALIALRFLAAVSDDTEWISKLIIFFDKYKGGKYHHQNTFYYYWLCLSELPFEIVESELRKYKDELIARLNKSVAMNKEIDKIHNPVLYSILRNLLCRLPEYAYIKDRQPYVGEKDGRLHFDLTVTD